MKRSVLFSLALVSGLTFLGLLVGRVGAQQGAPAAAAKNPEVVAVDIQKILKSSNRFKGMMDSMKRDVEAAETRLNAARQAIVDKETALANNKTWKPDSKEYKDLMTALLRDKTEFNVTATTTKQDLLEKETKLYYTTYKEICDEVAQFCQQYGINLVLKYNSDVTDGTSREAVYRELNKPILYLRKDMDITDHIINNLEARYGKGPPIAPAGPNGTVPSNAMGPVSTQGAERN